MITKPAMNPNWNELPIWAAMLIIKTAKGLLPANNSDFAWEWSTEFPRLGDSVIVVRKGEFTYYARKGARWVV